MRRDDLAVSSVKPCDLSPLGTDIVVARTMEAIATDTVLVVELVGEGIHIGVSWHRLVEGRIKYPHLRNLGEYLGYGFNPEDVRWIVQWCELCTLMKHRNYFGSDADALCEAFATVY